MNSRSMSMLLLALMVVVCASCNQASTGSQSQSSNPVLGEWTGKSGARDVTFKLHPDGTCEGLEPGITRLGRWQQKGPNVIIALDGDVFYGGLISRREMLITPENSRRAITLKKTSKQAPQRKQAE